MNEEQSMKEQIWRGLREIVDPEIGCSIVDLGIVYDVTVDEENAKIIMTLTSPGCPLHDIMVDGVGGKVRDLTGLQNVEVKVVWDPPWSPSMMSDELKKAFHNMQEME